MNIKQIEHSPWKEIQSIKTTNLVFTESELGALKKAVDILEKAEQLVLDKVYPDYKETHFCLAEYDDYTAGLFEGRYAISNLLEDHKGNEGIKI
jgi:hypothetical protein